MRERHQEHASGKENGKHAMLLMESLNAELQKSDPPLRLKYHVVVEGRLPISVSLMDWIGAKKGQIIEPIDKKTFRSTEK